MLYKDNIPNAEKILKRIDDLTEYINNFPDTPLAVIFQNELEYLETLKERYGI